MCSVRWIYGTLDGHLLSPILCEEEFQIQSNRVKLNIDLNML